jgi:glycogen operon protein
MAPEQWQDPFAKCFGMLVDGRARVGRLGRPAGDTAVLLVTNAHHEVVQFTLPELPGGEEWALLVDTNQSELEEPLGFTSGHVYEVTGRSLLLFELRTID